MFAIYATRKPRSTLTLVSIHKTEDEARLEMLEQLERHADRWDFWIEDVGEDPEVNRGGSSG